MFGGMAIVLSSAWPCAAQHAGDIWVGRTEAGQLNVGGFPSAELIVPLVSGGAIPGCANSNPGFDHLVSEIPEDDLYPLESGASIRVRITEIDPPLRLFDPGDFFNPRDTVGQTLLLGGSGLHIHPIWNIDTTNVAEYDELKPCHRLVLELFDTGTTGYAAMPGLLLRFVCDVECTPGDVDGDLVIDEADLNLIGAVIGNPAAATAEERCASDLTGDCELMADDEEALAAIVGPGVRPGDINGDGLINLTDFTTFATCFGATVEPPVEFCTPDIAARCDLDSNNSVNLADFSTFSTLFGT
jgi:hypothetical protein